MKNGQIDYLIGLPLKIVNSTLVYKSRRRRHLIPLYK